MAVTHQQATSQYGGYKTNSLATSDLSYLHEQQYGTGNPQPEQQTNSYSTTTQFIQGPVSTTTETIKHYPYATELQSFSNPQIAGNSQTVGHYQIAGNCANYQSSYSNATQHQGTPYRLVSGATETSRVIGHEYGEQRVISVTQRVDESRASVVSERYVEHEIRVPKKIVREEIVEKVIVIPEKTVHEEVIEETQKIRERIIEVAKPTIVEKIVEVPEIEYVERIVEYPERIVQEKIVNQDRIIHQERVIEVPKIIQQERVVEIPEIQYREVPFERVVEVPEYREEIIVREVPVTQYIDKPVPQHVEVEVPRDIERNIPVPVEAIVAYEYRMPRMKPRYSKITYPVYLPRFIEIPVATELLQCGLISQAETYLASVGQLTRSAASLCEIEGLATQIMKTDFQSQLASVDLQAAVLKAWQANNLPVETSNLTSFTTTGAVPYTSAPLAYTNSITTAGAPSPSSIDQPRFSKKSKRPSKSNN